MDRIEELILGNILDHELHRPQEPRKPQRFLCDRYGFALLIHTTENTSETYCPNCKRKTFMVLKYGDETNA